MPSEALSLTKRPACPQPLTIKLTSHQACTECRPQCLISCCLVTNMALTPMLTGNSAGLASGGNLSAEPRRGITKDSVFPDPVADWMTASLWLFRTLVALFCTSAGHTGHSASWTCLDVEQAARKTALEAEGAPKQCGPQSTVEWHTCGKAVAYALCPASKPVRYTELPPVSTAF